MAKKVTILGSTGSIGISAVKFLSKHKDEFEVVGLVGATNWKLMIEQAVLLRPKYVVLSAGGYIKEVEARLRPLGIEVLSSAESACEVSSIKVDIVLAAISGFAGLKPTLKAIEAGSNIALANKEALVCSGDVFINHAKKYGIKIIPVDSEHSAIFQVFDENKRQYIESIFLTCSGGPFRGFTSEQLRQVTIAEALNHPRWSMGPKITIDSATLMNKALEKIEAHYLFNMPAEAIKIIIHPESIIHGMITFADGSMLAQLSDTDMIIPISYALSWPERKSTGYGSINFEKITSLNFAKADSQTFPSLRMVDEVMQDLSRLGAVFNAANEVAVQAFIQGEIKFLDIYKIIELALENTKVEKNNTIEDVFIADNETRAYVTEYINRCL
jgi:1-deoxy-D-xylulose-5-phosphate reductoisomerase